MWGRGVGRGYEEGSVELTETSRKEPRGAIGSGGANLILWEDIFMYDLGRDVVLTRLIC